MFKFFKFNKYIGFWVVSEGLKTVVDTLSAYGDVKVRRTKDNKGYYVRLCCTAEAEMRCVNNILKMCRDGITILDLGIKYWG